MARQHSHLPHRYATTLDRAGLALATGGGLGGLVASLLAFAGGERGIPALLALAALGAVVTTLAIAAVGAPLWLALHRAGYRRAWHAAALGAALAMLCFVAGQTVGFTVSGLLRWLSAIATSALLAAVAAGIALAMWRVAYRPNSSAAPNAALARSPTRPSTTVA